MRYYLYLTILLILNLGLNAQDCEKFILQDSKKGDVHYLTSSEITLIIRGNLRLTLSLVHDARGVLGDVILKDGGILNQNDEIILLDANEERKNFRFRELGMLNDRDGIPVSTNTIEIGYEGLEWLASKRMKVLYLRKNLQYTMRKMTINTSRQEDFQMLCSCFLSRLDPGDFVKTPASEIVEDQEQQKIKKEPEERKQEQSI
jgi:hypothetical protein